MRLLPSLAHALVAILVARASLADELDAPPAPRADEAPARDASEAPPQKPSAADIRRPWLYTPDPTGPAPGHVVAAVGVGYASIDRGAARPFAADLAHAGAVVSAGAEVGLAPHLTVLAEGLLAGRGGDAPIAAGAMAGFGLYLARPGGPLDLALTGGYLRELGGANGVWARAAIAGDLGRARLTMSALGEHVFDRARDGVDLLVTAGVSYRVIDALRFGAEYVAQDLEGAWERDELDGGIKHFVGPNMALDLGSHRVKLVAGPAFGLSPGAPRLLGRLAAMYLF